MTLQFPTGPIREATRQTAVMVNASQQYAIECLEADLVRPASSLERRALRRALDQFEREFIEACRRRPTFAERRTIAETLARAHAIHARGSWRREH